MKRKIIFITKDEELYESLKRALKFLEKRIVLGFNEDYLNNKNNIILVAVREDDINELFYKKIRGGKYLNPVIVIGFMEEGVFKKGYPLFRDHPYNHSYLRIPFDLSELIDVFENMVPISSQGIRRAICGNDTGYKGYLLKLLNHDLLKDRERCEEILTMSASYLNEKIMSQEVKNVEKKIKEAKDWSVIASDIGKKIEKKIKETYHVQN